MEMKGCELQNYVPWKLHSSLIPFSLVVLALVLMASSERGFSMSLLEQDTNDLNYYTFPMSSIERLDWQYGWALAIERESFEEVTVHFNMNKFESQTLSGIGRPRIVDFNNHAVPMDTIRKLDDIVASVRESQQPDQQLLATVSTTLEDGSSIFASPNVLMQHCVLENQRVDIFREGSRYVILEVC